MSKKSKAVQTDEEETIVVFRKDKWGVTALFPGVCYTNGSYDYVCYSHVGGHSACSPSYINDTQPATPEEYADLKAELEQIGYKLKVRQKVMYQYLHYSKRKKNE